MSKWSKAKEFMEWNKARTENAITMRRFDEHSERQLERTVDMYRVAIEALEIAERLGGAEPKDIDICEECELDFVKDCSEWCYPARRYRDGYQQALEDVRGEEQCGEMT